MAAPGSESLEDEFLEGPLLERVVPLSDAQAEVWLADCLSNEASLAFNESVNLHVRGPLDVAALRTALDALVARHESLRSTVSRDGRELLVGVAGPADVTIVDLTGLADAAQREALARAQHDAVSIRFDLEQGPLFRATCYRLSADEHRVILTAHHIVCDGWSWGVILADLGALYGARGTLPSQPAAARYTDYVAWAATEAASPAMVDHTQFWIDRFEGSVPVLELPLDRPRPMVRTFNSARIDRIVPEHVVGPLLAVGRKSGASAFATVFGAFAATLHRLTQQDDLVIGVPAAGQSASGMTTLVGHCVNLLPIRIQVDPSATVPAFLSRVSGTLLDAFEHQTLTYGTLLRKLPLTRDASRLPLVSVMFNLDQTIQAGANLFRGLDVSFSANPRRFENFEVFVNAVQVSGGLRLEVQYNTDLFEAASIERWLDAYAALMASAADATAPGIGALPWLSPARRAEVDALQPPATPFAATDAMHSAFVRQAARTPDRRALRHDEAALSYAELDRRSNRLARHLRALGIGRGARVGLCISRSTDMVVALLGVLKSGAAYVPLDPGFPAARLAYYASDAQLALLVTESTQTAAPRAWRADASDRVLCLDTDAAWTEASDAALPPSDLDARPEDPAYVIYTSGSTGTPKGVCVPHRAVVNFITSMAIEPGLTEHDRLAAVTTLSFDIAVLELMLPLAVGAEVVMVSRETAIDGRRLADLLARAKVTVMQATPALWRMLVDAGWRPHGPFTVLVGGETLPTDLATALLDRTPAVWNMYGPTETTVWSAVWKVDPAVIRARGMSIGRPIANTTITIVDANQQPCPVGVPGEICIGGAGVALGYLNRPELTQDRFVPDRSVQGATIYRTGDRGRWRNDGLLEHLGRLDFQIKIRGYRIELGEIETACGERPDVAQCVAIVREDQPGDARLVVYVVPRGAFDEAALRTALASRLPEYMLPQHCVVVDRLPLLPNGKVDRKALPAPDRSTAPSAARVAPRTPLETEVLSAMEAVLNLPSLSVVDNFFALGGHSLLAARLVTRLGHDAGREIPLQAVFEAPTAERLAAWITAKTGRTTAPLPPIVRASDAGRAPASLMQQRLWFLERLDPGRPTYNTPSAHRLTGPLDVEAMERAFNEMVRRQPVLRTAIVEEDGLPWQRVSPSVTVTLGPIEDLSGLPRAEREAKLVARLGELCDAFIDVGVAPLFKVHLFRMAEDEHVLFFMPHHIIWDGWSFDLFYQEISELYDACSSGRVPALPELPVAYGDFAAWQQTWLRTDEFARQLAHWKAIFTTLPEPLDLPTDRPRPRRMTGGGATEWVNLDRGLVDLARQVGQGLDATLFMTLLAAYAALLHRLTGQTDIVIGTPVRGRQMPDVEHVMGFFVNALPLRLRVDPGASFADLVRQTRDVVLDGFSSPDIPFEHLVRELDPPRDESRPAVYQAFFSFQDTRGRSHQWGNLRHEQVFCFQSGSADDLGLWFLEHAGGLSGGLTYNTDILRHDTAQRLRDRFETVLRSATSAPQTAVARLPLLPASELADLEALNGTVTPYDLTVTVPALVEAQAARSPEAPALTQGSGTLTYRALHARANRVARLLRQRGAGRGTFVGICLERTPDLVVAQLAALKSGAAYVPLDPAYPADRLAFMASDAGLTLLLTDSTLTGTFAWPDERTICLDLAADTLTTLAGDPLEPGPETPRPEDPAYVIYTSGSTGKPKGVMVPHRAVVNFLSSMAEEPGLQAGDRLVAVTTLSFDIAVLELLLPLAVGAVVVLADRAQASDGAALRMLIDQTGATLLQATPTTWRMLIEAGWQGGPSFRALVGGEPLPPDLAAQMTARCGEVWNMYGPTETTVWSTCWRVAGDAEAISIGRPIANTTIHVLDDLGQSCALGVPGEIYIGGAGVALGYLGRPDLTAERFVTDPFTPGGVLYRTGDRGRWRTDGLLEHLGRLDFQVKLRGHRIELGEIEAHLTAHPGVSRAVAVVREPKPGDPRLVAYLVSRGEAPSNDALRAHLRASVPDYMVPQHFVWLDAVPLLPNGKVDRRSLPDPAVAEADRGHAQFVAPRTEAEQVLAGIWTELLGVPSISVTDNFFDLGGHSLLAVRAAERTFQALGRRVHVRQLIFETLEQIAAAAAERPLSSQQDTSADTPQTGWLSRTLSRLGLARD